MLNEHIRIIVPVVVLHPLCVYQTYNFSWSIQQHKWLSILFALAIVRQFKISHGISIKVRIHLCRPFNGQFSRKSINTTIFGFTVNIFGAFDIIHLCRMDVGRNTSNFTATEQLFINYPRVIYWQFEVVYSTSSGSSSSTLNFAINQSPQNGSCAIWPLNGTTSTVFTISCQSWFDEDGMKEYSLYSMKDRVH